MTPAHTISLRTAKAGDDIMQAPQTPARDETHANDATSLTSSFIHTRAMATTPHRHRTRPRVVTKPHPNTPSVVAK